MCDELVWEGGEVWRNLIFYRWRGDGSPCPLPLTHGQCEGAWLRTRAGCTAGYVHCHQALCSCWAQPWHCCPWRVQVLLCAAVSPQVFSEQGSSSPRRAPTSELYDVCLVQTDLLEAIADEDYFLRCVRRCEENYDRYLASTEKDALGQQLDGQ